MAYGVILEAEYQDGYVHSELDLNDTSPYVPGRNVFHDIVNHLPVEEHGKLIRFTLHGGGKAYNINWRDFPDDAKPIYYRKMHRQFKPDGTPVGDAYASSHFFGYEYHDAEGKKQKEIIELK